MGSCQEAERECGSAMTERKKASAVVHESLHRSLSEWHDSTDTRACNPIEKSDGLGGLFLVVALKKKKRVKFYGTVAQKEKVRGQSRRECSTMEKSLQCV